MQPLKLQPRPPIRAGANQIDSVPSLTKPAPPGPVINAPRPRPLTDVAPVTLVEPAPASNAEEAACKDRLQVQKEGAAPPVRTLPHRRRKHSLEGDLLRTLVDGPRTRDSIRDASGMSVRQVDNAITRAMQDALITTEGPTGSRVYVLTDQGREHPAVIDAQPLQARQPVVAPATVDPPASSSAPAENSGSRGGPVESVRPPAPASAVTRQLFELAREALNIKLEALRAQDAELARLMLIYEQAARHIGIDP